MEPARTGPAARIPSRAFSTRFGTIRHAAPFGYAEVVRFHLDESKHGVYSALPIFPVRANGRIKLIRSSRWTASSSPGPR